jgi:DNA-binding NarL/FixJ family response regulator
MLSADDFDLILLDLGLPDTRWRQKLLRVREARPDLAIVILASLDEGEVATQAVRLGAQDYLAIGDLTPSQLERSLRYAIERKQIETPCEKPRSRRARSPK